jgi:hypothetical protein
LQLYALLFAAEACVLLEDREAAEKLFAPMAERFRGTPFFWGGLSAAFAVGPTARLLGELARLTRRYQEAEALIEQSIELCRRIDSPPFLALSEAALERLRSERPASPAAPVVTHVAPSLSLSLMLRSDRSITLEREGELWAIAAADGTRVRIKHSKGLAYLSELLSHPGQSIHVLTLLGVDQHAGDAGPVLDARAVAEYRARLLSLEEQINEAESFGDLERATRAREEREALAEQLASAVGLGGRERRAASDVERARINVQRCIKDALDKIARAHPELARYLAATVSTGSLCSFTPL